MDNEKQLRLLKSVGSIMRMSFQTLQAVMRRTARWNTTLEEETLVKNFVCNNSHLSFNLRAIRRHSATWVSYSIYSRRGYCVRMHLHAQWRDPGLGKLANKLE